MQQCKNCNRCKINLRDALKECVGNRKGNFTLLKGENYQPEFGINWLKNNEVTNLLEQYGFSVLHRNVHQGIDVMDGTYKYRVHVSVQQKITSRNCYINVYMKTEDAEKIVVKFHDPQLDRS